MNEEILGYRVTVYVTVDRVETAGKEWKPTTVAEDATYAYTPEIQKNVQKEIEIFEQKLKTLDMQALVAVINGLTIPQKAGYSSSRGPG